MSRLGARLIAEARFAKWETMIEAAMRRALRVHRRQVEADVRRALGLTAASPPVDPFDAALWTDTLGRELTPVLHQVFAEVGESTLEGFFDDSAAYPPLDLSHHMDRMLGRMEGLGPEMSERLGTSLGEGFNAGEGWAELDRRVSDTFGVGERRASTIARTETVGAANGASYDVAGVMRDAGIALDKEWLATGDTRTRKTHEVADGQRVAFDAKFQVGACELDRPHDPTSTCAEEIVNCRCTLMFPEVEPAATRTLDARESKAMLVERFGEDPYLDLEYGTPAQAALAEYRGSGYRTINRVLRGDRRVAKLPAAEITRLLDDVIPVIDQQMTALPRAVTVIRDVDVRPVFGVDDPALLEAGQRFGERGYSSTAVRDAGVQVEAPTGDFGGGNAGVVMEMEVPEGTRAYWLSSQEDELLLQRDLTYEILGWDSARRVLRVRVIP